MKRNKVPRNEDWNALYDGDVAGKGCLQDSPIIIGHGTFIYQNKEVF